MKEPTLDIKQKLEKLGGKERAAIFMLSLPQASATTIFQLLESEDVKQLSLAMVDLGRVHSSLVEAVLWDFLMQFNSTGNLMGTLSGTEKFLLQFFPKEQVEEIINDIKGPAGDTVWDKLTNIKEDVLTNYLRGEHPQTIAVILSKISTESAGKVISVMPEDLAIDVINRMLEMQSIPKSVIDDMEKTLRLEFKGTLSGDSKNDLFSLVAEIFNSLDRKAEGRLMKRLESNNGDYAEQVKSLMFTFDDFQDVDQEGIRNIIRVADKTKLALSLKGVSEELQNVFFSCMTERAGKLLKDEMKELGQVRIRDVDEAQLAIVNVAKRLADKGEIVLRQTTEEKDAYIG